MQARHVAQHSLPPLIPRHMHHRFQQHCPLTRLPLQLQRLQEALQALELALLQAALRGPSHALHGDRFAVPASTPTTGASGETCDGPATDSSSECAGHSMRQLGLGMHARWAASELHIIQQLFHKAV